MEEILGHDADTGEEASPSPSFRDVLDSAAGNACFVTGTPSEAARVASLGYAAVPMPDDLDRDLLAHVKAMQEPPVLVPLLDVDAARDLAAAAAMAGVPMASESLMRQAWLHLPEALRGPESGLPDLLATLSKGAAAERAQAISDAMDRRLEALGVRPVIDIADLLETSEWEPTPTGIDAIDSALDGGLPSTGLAILGAVSSAGKTTLALQMADAMAESGRPVLFVTCEMAEKELAAKSISRLMKQQTDHGRGYVVATSNEILRASRRSAWDQGKREAYRDALAWYQMHEGTWEYVWEPQGQPTVHAIRERAEAMAEDAGRMGKPAPVVFIDYLQLLAPEDVHMTDKAATDANVMGLRQMARDLRTCVVAISAFNRSSYSTGATMEAFRESSSIEYSADVLLGLQPQDMGRDLAETAEQKRQGRARQILASFKESAVRDCELVVLKNRMGRIPKPIPLKYYAPSNCFEAGSLSSAEGRVL